MVFHEYEILEKMANGTFGIVFKVRRVTDHKLFVMKRIPLLDLNADQRRDAAQEIAVMQGLHHPCVVVQRDAFLYDAYDLCLILEYYDGGDMDTRMAAQREKDTYFDFEQVMLWFVQLVLGAQYLHAHHVIHRDIKSHNVFVRKRDLSVSLGDFGISEHFNVDVANRTWAAATMNTRKESLPTTNAAAAGVALCSCGCSSYDGFSAGNTPNDEKELQQTHSSSSAFYRDEGHLHTPDASPHRPSQLLQPPSKLRRDSFNTSAASPLLGSPQPPWTGGRMEAAMKGTPLYMAPEVLQGGAASPKSDVWSLGCVLYELLALRHPFESRDLATLVMRVSRGQREPLPPHYPRSIQDVINRMLHLNAAQRPTCEEVLTIPCVRSYVELWRMMRTPLDVPASLSETALRKQLTAWQANVDAAVAKRPQDPEVASVHHTDIEKQLMPPVCTPSEEREAVERRTTEAARAALLNAGPSVSLGSAASFNGAATAGGGRRDSGGVSDGTFFYGASGRHITGDMNGYGQEMNNGGGNGGGADVERGGPGDSVKFPEVGTGPTESMRPYMVYDARPPSDRERRRLSSPLDSPISAMCCENSPLKSTTGAAKRRPQQQQQRKQKKGEQHLTNPAANSYDWTSFSSSPTPATSPIAGCATNNNDENKKEQLPITQLESAEEEEDKEEKARRTQGNSPTPPAFLDSLSAGPHPSTSPPPPLRRPALPNTTNVIKNTSANKKKPLRTAGVTSLPASTHPLDEEVLFFKAYPNVADMRYASVEEVANAVVQLRQRVQQRMRHQRVLLDIEQVHTRHGSAPLQSMPNVLHVLAAAAAASTEREKAEAAAAAAAGNGGKRHNSKSKRKQNETTEQILSSALAPEEVYAHMVRQIDEERGGRQEQEAWVSAQDVTNTYISNSSRNDRVLHSRDCCGGRSTVSGVMMGRPPLARVHQLCELAALAEAVATRERLQRQHTENGPLSASSTAVPFADPAGPLRLSANVTTPHHHVDDAGGDDSTSAAVGGGNTGGASKRQRWSPYVQRRNSLSNTLTRIFDPVSLRAVYAYYFACPVLQRDAKLVRRLVPDRAQWTALPLVEELVVLDRHLQPLLDKAEESC